MQQEADFTDHEKLIGIHIFTIAQYRLSQLSTNANSWLKNIFGS